MFSPVKLILLLVVVAAVFLAVRFLRGPVGEVAEKTVKRAKSSLSDDDESTDLVKCPKCGTYVASLENHTCSK